MVNLKIIHTSFSTSLDNLDFFVASNKLSLDLDNEIMITWTANENIWYDFILIAINVISNTLEYVLGTTCFTWKRVGRGVCYVFFIRNILIQNFQGKTIFCKHIARKNYSNARFSPHKKIAFFWFHGSDHSPHPFKLKGRSLTRFHSYIFFTWVWIQWYFL